jgi:hypothetical protein
MGLMPRRRRRRDCLALGGEGALACAELHEVDTLRDIGSMTQVTPLLLAALLSLPLAGGCASACKRVAADRQEFLARPVQTSAPQMALVLPLAALSQEMTRKLARARPMSLNLPRPGIAGFDLDLGAASARLTSITVLPAADDHLGFRVAVGLGSGNQAIATIELEAEVRPQLDLSRGAVTVSLSPRDIASLRPRLPPAEERRLGDFLWSKVPGLARQLIDRGTIDGVVRQLSRDLLGPMWPKIRDSLLADVGTLTEFTIDLPDELPIAALALRSSPADLELAVTLALPASGLARAPRSQPWDARGAASGEDLRLGGGGAGERGDARRLLARTLHAGGLSEPQRRIRGGRDVGERGAAAQGACVVDRGRLYVCALRRDPERGGARGAGPLRGGRRRARALDGLGEGAHGAVARRGRPPHLRGERVGGVEPALRAVRRADAGARDERADRGG